jgi:hypothetical protein
MIIIIIAVVVIVTLSDVVEPPQQLIPYAMTDETYGTRSVWNWFGPLPRAPAPHRVSGTRTVVTDFSAAVGCGRRSGCRRNSRGTATDVPLKSRRTSVTRSHHIMTTVLWTPRASSCCISTFSEIVWGFPSVADTISRSANRPETTAFDRRRKFGKRNDHGENRRPAPPIAHSPSSNPP